MNRSIPAVVAALFGAAVVCTASGPAHADPAGARAAVADLAADQWIPGAAAAKRLEYRTQNSLGEPALSSGALFVPNGTPPPGGWPVVAWEHGTVGRADDCAPTRTDFTFYRPYLQNLLSQGFAVAATDYIGLGTPGEHAYLDGRAAANSAIDLVRAARALDPSLSARWAAVGHSQGGHAALFTAAQATTYAPELDYRGAIAIAPGASITDTLLLLGRPGTPDILPAGMKTYTSYVLGGLRAARPGFDLDAYLTPLGRRIVADSGQYCYDDMTARLERVSMADMFTKPLADGGFEAMARSVLDVPTTGYDHPLLIVQGSNDIDVPAPMLWKQVADLRAAGVGVDTRDYPGYDHMQALDDTYADTNTYLHNLFR
ncbi:alpha/beta fold hydrolase [Nocardia sp. 2]|uniref:Alpha/beta fold hydrolase n=1 Tax=Nocardia acididurans TaxID=2802282 RepID=A0ABS1M7I6_9NOCA|nr:lipase family protein [Nocardia acididurans]MBL1076526.1 alpha/beta fold hydrolase [Nocardia acididurans]